MSESCLFSRLYAAIESKTGVTEHGIDSSEAPQPDVGLISVMRKMCSDPMLKKALPSFQLPLIMTHVNGVYDRVAFDAYLELHADKDGNPQVMLRTKADGQETYKDNHIEIASFLSGEGLEGETLVEGLAFAILNTKPKGN